MSVELENLNIENQIAQKQHLSPSSLSFIAKETQSQPGSIDLENLQNNQIQSQKHSDKQTSTQDDPCLNYLSLRNIKSKQEIEIQSRQNEEILLNINFNIDDLFKKISSLTEQVNKQLEIKPLKQSNHLKQISLWSIEQNNNISLKQIQGIKQKQCTKITSPLNSKQQCKRTSFNSVFFLPHSVQKPNHGINMKLFQTGKSLGCGKFGEVIQCRNVKTGYLYALKKIFKSVIQQYQMQGQLLTQLQILSQINHPNIVKSYQSFTDDFHIFIVMEYIHGKSLTTKFKCSQNQAKTIIKQVLQAVKYLHEKKIVHRDIKPQNIILTSSNIVKICDFGWAAQGDDEMNILCGTLDYISPEMAQQKPYNQSLDLWNVGVLTYQLLYGFPPFKGGSKQRIFQKVKNLQYSFPEQIQVSQQSKSFIAGYLKRQEERQSIQWGFNHPFLRQDSSKLNQQQQQQRSNIDETNRLNSNDLASELQNLFTQQEEFPHKQADKLTNQNVLNQ